MPEPFCCLPETITTFLVSYTPIQNKSLKKKKEKKKILCVDEWIKECIPPPPLVIGSTFISVNSQIVFVFEKVNSHCKIHNGKDVHSKL